MDKFQKILRLGQGLPVIAAPHYQLGKCIVRIRGFTMVLLAMGVSLASAATAQDYQAGPLKIDHAWARPSIGGTTNSSVYMTLSNSGDVADRLLAVKTDVASDVMLHESRMEGEVMKMVPLEKGVEVPAHGSVELKPLGMHVMLMGLRQPLKEGDTFPVTLVFEKQGEVPIKVKVTQQPAAGQ
jgi:periplasmic copper chaperone A